MVFFRPFSGASISEPVRYLNILFLRHAVREDISDCFCICLYGKMTPDPSLPWNKLYPRHTFVL